MSGAKEEMKQGEKREEEKKGERDEIQAQMVQLAELLGIVGRKGNSIEETDDEQDLDFK